MVIRTSPPLTAAAAERRQDLCGQAAAPLQIFLHADLATDVCHIEDPVRVLF
jgi:hypothetical protein